MDFFTLVDETQSLVQRHGKLSLRGLRRQFGDDPELIAEIAAELVTRGVASFDGETLTAITGDEPVAAAPPEPTVAASAPAEADQTDIGEIRHMTVLFCDVVGSTELSGKLDPETWTDVIRGFHRLAVAAIEAYDGYVGNYIGDGIIAYFGYPLAQEDSAERAVRAGLDVVASLGPYSEQVEAVIGRPVQTRVGVHSGPVVMEYFGGNVQVMGKTANVASRIEGAAPPNGVALSADTRNLVGHAFELVDLGLRELKGVAEPMQVSQAIRVSGADGVSPRRLRKGTLVGRGAELSELRQRWEHVVEGSGQMVEVVGEAGIGKSRLLDAFRTSIAGEHHAWLDAACSSYAQSAPLMPVVDLQRRALGFTTVGTDAERREVMYRALGAAGLDADRGVKLMAGLHGLAADDTSLGSAQANRLEMLDLLVEWVLRLARQRPTVLTLDDVHWADPTTLELVARIADQIGDKPLLIIVLTRFEGAPVWPRRSNFSSINLGRIGREHLVQIAAESAGRSLPDDVVESIVQRADGVPLFAEELAAAMSDPDASGGVPDTLQNLLMARIERLGALRGLAQLASVIGRDFGMNELCLIADLERAEVERLLEVGVQNEIFFRRGARADLEFYFKHALLRDAVYKSMLGRTRRARHDRFAAALLATRRDLVESRPDLIAEHYTLAESFASASEWWQRAAERAELSAAMSETEYFYRRAAETTDPSQVERLVRLKMALAGAINATRGFGHPDVTPVWDDVLTLSRGAGFEWERAVAQSARGSRRVTAGKYESARVANALARSSAEEIGANDVLIGIAQGELAMLNFEGRPAEVLDEFERLEFGDLESIEAYDRTMGIGSVAMCHAWRSYSLAQMGYYASAYEANDLANDIAARTSTRSVTQTNLITLRSTISLLRGDHEEYLKLCEQFLESARRYELSYYTKMGYTTSLTARATLYPHAEALKEIGRHLGQLSGTGNLIAAPIFAWSLAGAQMACGEPERALEAVGLAASLSEQTHQRWYDGQILARRLLIEQSLDRLADGWLDEIEVLREFTREHSLAVGALHLALAQVELGGATPVALDEVRRAVDAIPEPGDAPIVETARALLTA